MIAPWEKKLWQSEIVFKKQRYHLANNGPYSQSYDFSSSHVLIRELDHKEGWTLKNWCFQIVLTSRSSNQSILNKISPEYSLERLRLGWSSNTLASWCKESTHWMVNYCQVVSSTIHQPQSWSHILFPQINLFVIPASAALFVFYLIIWGHLSHMVETPELYISSLAWSRPIWPYYREPQSQVYSMQILEK